MHRLFSLSAVAFALLAGTVPQSSAQSLTTPAPDGTPGATFVQGCVTSHFFNFTYRLPDGMSLADMSRAPNGGNDPTGRNFVLFMAHRARGINQDVVNAAAEDRRQASDSSAASWMRALHNLNKRRQDIPTQGEVESVPIGDQQLARLRFQQSRDDGVITYESAYAIGVRGYVVYFIFGSIDQAALASLERSMGYFSAKDGACAVSK